MWRRQIIAICFWCAMVGASAFGAGRLYDVRDYGAKPDGKTLCTQAIQKAIDECAKDGGGTALLSGGVYLTGTIYLKSGVTLRIDDGCVLLGSGDLKRYPPTVPAFRSYADNYTDKSLIYGENLQRIAITGGGIIDGQGGSFKGPYKQRPYIIRFVQCKDVTVRDVNITNSPMWVQQYLACDDVRIDGITVRSHVNANNDGIDIDSCHRVIVSSCNVDSGDDAIVLKSTSARSCRDVVVTGCILRSNCNALKLGTESNGGFENIVLTGCTIYDTQLAGVALEIVDGGTLDRVVVSNMTMSKVGAPIFLRLGNRARPFKEGMDKPAVGKFRNVTISNIEADGADATGCAISGIPGAMIENVTVSNVRFSFAGGGTAEQAHRTIAEEPEKYPEYSMFGRLAAYGLYCRHIKGLKLLDVQVQLAADDLRHGVVFEDVQDAVIDTLDAPNSAGAAAQIRLTNASGVFIRGCRPKPGTEVFLELQGKNSGNIVLAGNDLSAAARPVEFGPDVPKTAIVQEGNCSKQQVRGKMEL